MIASLRGRLTESGPGACVVEAGGVGYLVQVSSHTAAALPPRGEEVSLRTRQIVREDSLQLFGFLDAGELRLFDLLIGVSGIGPRLAIAVLSGLPAARLAAAIRDGHVAALVAIPGIGRKTAERLVVELRDRMGDVAAAPEPEAAGARPVGGAFDDAVAALATLGYTRAQAQQAVRAVTTDGGDDDTERLVRRALARLARPAATAR